MKLLSIGEVAKQVNVASHTVRFWTEEFTEYIKFEIGKGDRRYYPNEAVEVFKKINHLIHEEGIKIRVIKEKKLLLNQSNPKLTQIKNTLEEILETVKRM